MCKAPLKVGLPPLEGMVGRIATLYYALVKQSCTVSTCIPVESFADVLTFLLEIGI